MRHALRQRVMSSRIWADGVAPRVVIARQVPAAGTGLVSLVLGVDIVLALPRVSLVLARPT